MILLIFAIVIALLLFVLLRALLVPALVLFGAMYIWNSLFGVPSPPVASVTQVTQTEQHTTTTEPYLPVAVHRPVEVHAADPDDVYPAFLLLPRPSADD